MRLDPLRCSVKERRSASGMDEAPEPPPGPVEVMMERKRDLEVIVTD